MPLLTFNWQSFFMFFIVHCFFILMLKNPAPFSLNFSSPMTYSSKERSSQIAPSAQPHPSNPKKIPLKTSVHFPIAIAVCKHWSKFVTCSPSSGDCGGKNKWGMNICWTKWLSQNFDPLTLGKKMSVGGGLDSLQFFWSLKKGTRTFHFH